MRRIGALFVLSALAACEATPNGRFTGPERQVAAVGQELIFEMSLDGIVGTPAYKFEYDGNFQGTTKLAVRNDGNAVIAIRPTGKDLGEVMLEVTAQDGVGPAVATVEIEVRSTVGSATLPRFNRPQGEGTSLNVDQDDCVEIEVLIDDQDTAEVDLVEVDPLIEGSTLQVEGNGAAIWRWCPTEKQRAERDRYVLTLGADDGENPLTLKRYLIVLDNSGKLGCDGALPAIVHEATNQTTLDAVEVRAAISDLEGLKGAPLILYTFDKLDGPPNPREMIQLTMVLESGDARSAEWSARLPNPSLEASAGEARPLHYRIVVEDNDGRNSDCDHQVFEDFSIAVTRPETGPALPYCEPCSTDLQCGSDADLCLTSGILGDTICSTSCGADSDCPGGSYCSPEPLTSVDGATGRQCVPENDVCEIEVCADGRLEPNDSRAEAAPLAEGVTEDLRICPIGHLAADEDWYQIDLDTDSQVDLGITADTYPNLDLRIFDESGTLVAASEDWGSEDSVSRCLPAGTYHARVYSAFAGENDYRLSFTPTTSSCPVSECTADPYEDDDDIAGARVPDFEGFVYRATGNSICTGDQDWFHVFLFGDETVYGAMTFDQTLPSEDLDFLVYDSTGALLTPCTIDDASGCSDNGQSSTSNETFEFTAATAGEYYVVVNGFDGATNDYEVCLSLQDGLCN